MSARRREVAAEGVDPRVDLGSTGQGMTRLRENEDGGGLVIVS